MVNGKLAGSLFKYVKEPSFILPNVIIPLGVMSLYLALSAWLLPSGVNNAFVTRFAIYLVPTTALLYIAFFITIGSRKNGIQFFKLTKTEWSAQDSILLLLPLSPVLQYIQNNNGILSGVESVLVFCVLAVLVSIPVVFFPYLLGRTGSYRPVVSIGLAFAFSITIMPSLSAQFAWHEVGALKTQLAVFGGVWFISLLMFQFEQRNFMHVLVILLFLTNAILQTPSPNRETPAPDTDETGNAFISLVDSREPANTPNIYLLIYDAYVVNETMSAYGIDNQPQEQYLANLGFKIYPHTYSVGSTSLLTMNRLLNVSTSEHGNPWKGVSGDGVVQNTLEGFEYKTYGIFPSDFFFRGEPPSYDKFFPNHGSSVRLLIDAILIGEFRFDIEFDKVSREQFIHEKGNAISEVQTHPKFMYSHSNLPGHSQNSGACVANEVELYDERLAKANIEMNLDVEAIITNDPDAIVIIAGDHGPYLTKNCSITEGTYALSEISRLDIQDRYGTFLAIRWPSSNFEAYDDITVLQDVFPAIFAYLFEDTTILKSKINPMTLENEPVISGATVIEGVIIGGINNGEALFTDAEKGK